MVEISGLKVLDIFSTLSNSQLQQIAAITSRRAYKVNALIYRQGQPAGEIFIVEKGLVSLRSFKAEDNMAVAFDLCEPGQILGAASLLKEPVYTLTALCMEPSHVLAIDAAELSRLCEMDFELGYKLMKKVAQLYFDRYEAAKRELGFPVIDRKSMSL